MNHLRHLSTAKSWAIGAAVLALAGLVQAQSAPPSSQTRTSAFEYDPTTGLLTKEIIEPDNPNLCVVTTYGYDTYGNKTSATTANCAGATGDAVFASRTTTTSYAAAAGAYGNSVNGQFPTSVTNALGQTETRQYDVRYGAATRLVGPNGLATTWEFDEFGRKTQETLADGNKTQWAYRYCAGVNGGSEACGSVMGVPSGSGAGAWVEVATPLNVAGVANGLYTKTYSDSLGRVYRQERETHSSTTAYQDTWYYRLGEPAQASRPYFAVGGTPYYEYYEYDALRRPVKVRRPDENNALWDTVTTYNGLTTSVLQPNGYTKSTVKNSQGQIKTVIDETSQQTTYEYDALGNLWRTTDPLGNQVKIAYDLRGRKIQQNDPDLGVWNYAYNALGELVRQVSAKAETTTMVYDKLGRMTQRSEPDTITSWYYDAYKGGGVCSKGIGKLCQTESSNTYNRTHSYDALGRLQSTTSTIVSPYTENLTYDANGRLSSRTYPSGLVVYHLYTTKGMLGEIRRDSPTGQKLWSATSIDAENHVVVQAYGNGVSVTRSYNPATGRVTVIGAGAGNGVQYEGYGFDGMGNMWGRIDALTNVLETFTYDGLNRLTGSTINSNGGITTKTYGYDALGNLKTRSDFSTTGGYVYNPSGAGSVRPHAVTQVNLAAGGYRTYAYDANGAMTGETHYNASSQVIPNKGRSITYMNSGKVNQMSVDAGGAYYYFYDSEQQRIVQGGGGTGVATVYVNPGTGGAPLYEVDFRPDGSSQTRQYIAADGRIVAVITNEGATQKTTWLHHDGQGSTMAVTDANGSVLERMAYEPFGKRRFVSNGADDPNNTIVPQNTNRGYTFHEHVDALRLVNMNGRFYDPMLARFISADPFIQEPFNPQNYNRYSYVINNPMTLTDPSGYKFWRSVLAIAVATYIGYGNFEWLYSAQSAGGAGLVAGNAGANAFIGGFFAGAINTGSLQGAIMGSLTAGAFNAAGTLFPVGSHFTENVMAHAVVGCASAVIGDGSCRAGAYAGGFSAWATPGISGSLPAQVTQAAVIGGVGSVLGGGKFGNGAVTGAFGYLFNYLSHVHKDLTMRAARDAGLSARDALDLGVAVKNADFVDGTQDPQNAHQHAMCADSNAAACRAAFDKFLTEQWNSKTQAGFARFLHAWQDQYAGGHGFRIWDGGNAIGLPDRAHIQGDLYPAPDLARRIIDESAVLIRAYRSFCPECFKTTKP